MCIWGALAVNRTLTTLERHVAVICPVLKRALVLDGFACFHLVHVVSLVGVTRAEVLLLVPLVNSSKKKLAIKSIQM